MKKLNIDPETRMVERSINIEDILETKNITNWGRQKGKNMF